MIDKVSHWDETSGKPIQIDIDGHTYRVPNLWTVADALQIMLVKVDVSAVDKVFLPSTALEAFLGIAPTLFAHGEGGISLATSYKHDHCALLPHDLWFKVKGVQYFYPFECDSILGPFQFFHAEANS